MKIGIDLSQISENKTGIEYYTHQLVKSLIELDSKNSYFLYTNNKEFCKKFKSSTAKIVEVSATRPNTMWIWKVSRKLKEDKIDILISPSFFTFSIFFSKTIQLIHDIAPIRHPEFWPKLASIKFKFQLALAVRFAKGFATNSEFTKDDFLDVFPKAASKTFVIGTGLTDWAYAKPSIAEQNRVKESYNLSERFFLSVSTLQPRKNYIRCIKAFKKFLEDYPTFNYYIVGQKGWYFEEIFQVVKDLDLEKKVIFLDYVPEEDLAPLFDLSTSFIYCSLMEGFGLPVIEAYSRDVPVVASDLEVIKQTMGDKIVYANPLSESSIAEALKKSLIYNTSVNEKFIEDLNWKVVATKLIEGYKSVDKKIL